MESNESTATETVAAVNQAFINRTIMAEVLDLDKHVAWTEGAVLDQLVVRRTEEGWLGMVKASIRSRPVVTFVYADTLVEALELIGDFAARGSFEWSTDKWPSKLLKPSRALK